MQPIVTLAAILLFGLTVSVRAETPRWSIKGFGSAAITGTDTGALGFRRDISQDRGARRGGAFEPDSRLGLQLDLDFSETWQAGAQWVARSHPGDFVEQNLDWAYLRWRPWPDLDIRLGRLGFDVFMLSEYRNVGYAYPWIRPPHEFYGGLPSYHFDGADIAKKFSVGEGFVTAKIFGGHSFYQVPAALSETYDAASLLAGGSLVYERGNWRARIGYVHTETLRGLPLEPLMNALQDPAVTNFWPGASSLLGPMRVEGSQVQYSSIGLGYDDGTWLAQLEAAYVDSDLAFYPSGANGYLSVGRRIGPVTLFSLLGIAETVHEPVRIAPPLVAVPALLQFRDGMEQILNGNGIDEKSVSLGLRWDLHENVALKAQWSHYWLGQNGAQLWVEPFFGRTPAEVNQWSLGLDFVF